MRTGSSRYAWYRGDIVIDFITCANAKAFIESTRGYLPSIEAEIEKFKADWEEIDRKFKQKQGYWHYLQAGQQLKVNQRIARRSMQKEKGRRKPNRIF